jgi:hypothetical protein
MADRSLNVERLRLRLRGSPDPRRFSTDLGPLVGQALAGRLASAAPGRSLIHAISVDVPATAAGLTPEPRELVAVIEQAVGARLSTPRRSTDSPGNGRDRR